MNGPKSPQNRYLMMAVFLVPVVWAAVIVAPHLSQGGLFTALGDLTEALNHPFRLQWVAATPKFIAIFVGAYAMCAAVLLTETKTYRHGEEHGSAKWGAPHKISRKYCDKDPLQNKILTQNVRIGFDGHKHRHNLHLLAIGGSGAGKTMFVVKPALNSCGFTSYICLDPKGENLRNCGHLLKEAGYDVKVIDLINMEKSFGYNPFVYLRNEVQVMDLIANLIANTTPKNAQQNDPFWERSEQALLSALIFYLLEKAPPEEQNFSMVMEMLRNCEVREDDELYQNAVDELFERLEMDKPDSLAVKQYKVYKLAAGKTAKSILVSLAVRLEKFNLPQLARITQYDEMQLAEFGERKMALFAVTPDSSKSFSFLVGMLYTQLFQELYYQADKVHKGRLPVHVQFLMDEFANVALPDDFDTLLSTMRSREISVSIILQNLAQLKALYKDKWESIMSNCDQMVYLGGNSQGDHEMVSKLIGSQNLNVRTYGRTKGRNGSFSINDQLQGRELVKPDEVRRLDNDYALLFMRGELPIMDKKYNVFKHPNFHRTEDGGAPPFDHGSTQYATDWGNRILNPNGDYVVLSTEAFIQHAKGAMKHEEITENL